MPVFIIIILVYFPIHIRMKMVKINFSAHIYLGNPHNFRTQDHSNFLKAQSRTSEIQSLFKFIYQSL